MKCRICGTFRAYADGLCSSEECAFTDWKSRAEKAEAEVERQNKMHVHCEKCGAYYLQTGLEAGCPCELRKEVERLREDIDHAAKRAKSYQPEYPFTRNTASEAVWVCGEAYRGVKAANESWRAVCRDSQAEVEHLRKLCAERPVRDAEESLDEFDCRFASWAFTIDAAGRGDGKA